MENKPYNEVLKQAHQALNTGNFEQARGLWNEIQQNIHLLKNHAEEDTVMIECFNGIALSYGLQGNLTEALRYFEHAGMIAKKSQDTLKWGDSLANIGNIYSMQRDYNKAASAFEEALEWAALHHADNLKAKVMGYKGNMLYYLADYQGALQAYEFNAFHYANTNQIDQLAHAYSNIGSILKNLKQYERCEEYYQKAMEIYIQKNMTDEVARVEMNLGHLFADTNQLSKAIALLEKVGHDLMALGQEKRYMSSRQSLGKVYLMNGSYDEAFKWFQYCEQHPLIEHDYHQQALLYQNLCELFQKKNYAQYALNQSIHYGKLALEKAQTHHFKKVEMEVYDQLSAVYTELSDWKLAWECKSKAYSLYQQIQTEESNESSHKLDIRRKMAESEKDRQAKIAKMEYQEKLLNNILPHTIANRMMNGESAIADRVNQVGIFFSDIVGFTSLSAQITPEELVQGLNEVFTAFDTIANTYKIEKIKTIGDAYMAVSGLTETVEYPCWKLIQFALEVCNKIHDFKFGASKSTIDIRIGLHCGDVVAGVIGHAKFAYDIWGDAVNLASRMESHGKPGFIHVSSDFKTKLEAELQQLFNHTPWPITFEDRGAIAIKGKENMTTFFIKPSIAV